MCSSTLSLTSVLGEGGWSRPRSGRFAPGKESRYRFYRKLGNPGADLASTEIRNSDRATRSESLYRLSYPGPHSVLREV